MISNFAKGSKVFYLFWVAIALGSCTYIQTNHYRTTNFSYGFEERKNPECSEFKRTIRLDHKRPPFPRVDIRQLTSEEVSEILLTHTEALTKYLNNEERFLLEDIARYNSRCGQNLSTVFQK